MSDYSLILIDPCATACRVSSLSTVTEQGGIIKPSLLMNQDWSVSINICSTEKSPVFLLIWLLFIFNMLTKQRIWAGIPEMWQIFYTWTIKVLIKVDINSRSDISLGNTLD